jgi:hypothetical protein
METWDEDYFNEEVQAFIEFEANGTGHFQFGYVRGYMDWRPTTRDGEPAVEWSWEGNDEMDPAQGRGWAKLQDADLHGMLFIHLRLPLELDDKLLRRLWLLPVIGVTPHLDGPPLSLWRLCLLRVLGEAVDFHDPSLLRFGWWFRSSQQPHRQRQYQHHGVHLPFDGCGTACRFVRNRPGWP